MNLLVLIRAIAFVFFTLFSIIVLAIASWNVSVVDPTDTFIVSMDTYVIAISSITTVFMFPLIIVDFMRYDIFVTKVWFELVWLSLFWVLYLVGASALTAAAGEPICTTKNFVFCQSSQILVAFLWLIMTTLLIYLFTLVVSSIYYSQGHPQVWLAAVRDFQWFNGGGGGTPTVTPLPSSPMVKGFQPRRFSLQAAPAAPFHPYSERQQTLQPLPEGGMTASQLIRHQVLTRDGRPVGMTEVSTTQGLAPLPLTHAPSRRAAHYTAVTVSRIDERPQPARRSSRDAHNNPALSLYPNALNKALNASGHGRQSSRDAVIPPAPQANNALGLQTQNPEPSTQRQPQQQQGYSTYTSNRASATSPPPIRNWPRVNPQEPIRRDVGRRVAPPYPAPTANPVMTQNGRITNAPAELISSQTESDRERPQRPIGPRPTRHRPPPLDLSRANPVRR